MANVVYLNFKRKNSESIKLLVIEEQSSIVNFCNENFSDTEIKILRENRIENLIASINENKPGIILIDSSLTYLNTLNVLKLLKLDPNAKNIPIIIVSNQMVSDNIQAGIEAGADDYIISPFTKQEFLKKVTDVVHS